MPHPHGVVIVNHEDRDTLVLRVILSDGRWIGFICEKSENGELKATAEAINLIPEKEIPNG